MLKQVFYDAEGSPMIILEDENGNTYDSVCYFGGLPPTIGRSSVVYSDTANKVSKCDFEKIVKDSMTYDEAKAKKWPNNTTYWRVYNVPFPMNEAMMDIENFYKDYKLSYVLVMLELDGNGWVKVSAPLLKDGDMPTWLDCYSKGEQISKKQFEDDDGTHVFEFSKDESRYLEKYRKEKLLNSIKEGSINNKKWYTKSNNLILLLLASVVLISHFLWGSDGLVAAFWITGITWFLLFINNQWWHLLNPVSNKNNNYIYRNYFFKIISFYLIIAIFAYFIYPFHPTLPLTYAILINGLLIIKDVS